MRKVGRDRDDREGIDDDGAVEKWCLATPLASNARNDDGGDNGNGRRLRRGG